ncbi:MAG: hypothetical protein ACUVQ8_08595 [Nitrososphaeria archaeon]
MRIWTALVLMMALAVFLVSAKYYPLGRQKIEKKPETSQDNR